MAVISKRESCAMCHDIIHVGFLATKELWEECIRQHYQHSSICLRCFARVADEKLLAWEKGVTLFPMSLRTHLDNTSTSANVVDAEPALVEGS